MADRTEELRGTAAQCLALAQSTPDPLTRAALISQLAERAPARRPDHQPEDEIDHE